MASILVVDRDLQVRELYEKALKAVGHRVHCVEDGKEALEDIGLRAPGATFNVMITNMVNVMAGDKLSVEVRKKSPTTKIIMISTLPFSGENHRCDMILQKPVSMDLLVKAVACFA
ncbi:MAG: response regulator [bacterium]|nr:response regulator [bacterium]